MSVKIYKPAKTAMSSGSANTKSWVLEFSPSAAREVDPLMGWISSVDTESQIKLNFSFWDKSTQVFEAPVSMINSPLLLFTVATI